MEEGLALLDDAARLVTANAALARLAGSAPRPGLPLDALFAPAAGPDLAAALAAARAGGAPPALRLAPAAAGAVAWRLTLHPLPAGLAPRRWLLLRVVAADGAAAPRPDELDRLAQLGWLAGGVAHDVNNLLAVILAGAAGVREAGLPPAAARALEPVEEAARRGGGMLRQVLAGLRRETPAPQPVALDAALRGMAPMLRHLLGRAVRLELALAAPEGWLRLVPAQLDQLLLNLAANARDAMPGGGRLRIATRFHPAGRAGLPPGDWLALEVSDTGIGIPAERLPRLFEPFFTTRAAAGGTGLGLATVQRIVAGLGGHVSVESRVGEGSRFRILLPPAPPPPQAAPGLPPAALPQAADGLVLLVEDEAALRRLGTRLLERAGHAVLAAESGESALALLEGQRRPALLVSDLALPGMDGLALARGLRQRWPGLPVLLLSGYGASGVETRPDEDFPILAKPFEPAALLRAVALALRRVPAPAA
ncbi:ATP-binding protein [Roseicella frigidaeris]|uniref:ATP-binding protein n=1 Tax=Roseicella frigidaeris TaxID=2230885 RepID=UPI000FDD998A|nr:ATP-binding protein [Roseicella frigidaeris]